jgi:tetratricopeptide (TPR) repeat protein
MNGTRTPDQATACLKLALERNEQLFSEAHKLSSAALDLLDRPDMDAEIFTQYQEMRRYADGKYHEAIEHLRSIMTEYPFSPSSAEIPPREPPVSADRYEH